MDLPNITTIVVIFLILFVLCLMFRRMESANKRTASLTGAQEVPKSDSQANGKFVSFVENGKVSFSANVSDLSGEILSAHIHKGSVGQNGPAVRTLTFVDNKATGVWSVNDDEPLTKRLIEDLNNGDLYVNIHTEQYPLGEIRGQIVKA